MTQNSRERIDENAWNKIASISIEIVLFLLSKYSFEINKEIKKLYGAASSSISLHLEKRFPILIHKIKSSETIKMILSKKKYLKALYKKYIGDDIFTEEKFKKFLEIVTPLFSSSEKETIKKVIKK